MPMDCEAVQSRLELYVLGELSPEAEASLRGHLRGCAACQSSMAEATRLLESVDRVLREPAVSPGLAVRVISRVERVARYRRLGVGAVCAAACVALVACAAALWWPRGGEPVRRGLTVADLVGCRIGEGVPGGAGGGGPAFEVLGRRHVRLDRGELIFDVASDDEPFVVDTPTGSATVLGTQFRVRTGPAGGGETMKGARFVTMVVVLSGVVQFANPYGTAVAAEGETIVAEEGAAPQKHSAALANRFGMHYKPIEVTVKPSVPAYSFPVKVSAVDSLEDILTKHRLAATPHLTRHGFAVYPMTGQDDFVKAYGDLKKREVPILVTTDSVLHLYHMQFDKILQSAEETELSAGLGALLESLDGYVASGGAKADKAAEVAGARRLARAYLHLVRRLLTDRTAERPLLEALRADVEKAGRRSWGLAGKHQEAVKCFADPGPVRSALNSVPRGTKADALKLIDAELKAIDASKPKTGALPESDEAAIARELELIAAHEGFKESPLFVYEEDYSQYVPRGHYTRSPLLKRYFKAMMYLGRLTFLLKGGEPHGSGSAYLVSEAEARRQTLAAALLTEAVANAKQDDGVKASDIWTRIYDVTAFMVGTADDLGYEEYVKVLRNPRVFSLNAYPKDMMTAPLLVPEENFFEFKKRIGMLQGPAIYSGTGNIISFDPTALAGIASEEELDKQLDKTLGFRLFGQRFVPDSYWMGRLVFPSVGAPLGSRDPKPFTWGMTAAGPRRVFPRGLDVAALLGSKRATAILARGGDTAYDGYDKMFDGLKVEIGGLDDAGWNVNLYWSWLHCLKPLLVEFGPGYPTYMREPQWQDKELVTALGSWSQLRHDTILYVKQSYTMRAGSAPRMPAERPGYVEAVPEFYARLLALCRLTRDRMGAMKCLDEEMVRRLEATDKLLARLLDISKRELENKMLEKEDFDFIRTFGASMRTACMGRYAGMEARNELKTSLVADVHTDGNTGKVLEEATGDVALLVVVNRLPDGKLYAACGPVFTHYEFKQPMSDRLTDEAWRTMLKDGKGRPDLLPDWFREGLGAGWGQ